MNRFNFSFPHSPLKLASFVVMAIFFAIIAVIFLITANGYKVEFKDQTIKLTKTGTIIIASQPAGAKIYLDDKLIQKTTGSNLFTTKIKGVLPGSHHIKFEKEGYIPWEKNVEVIGETVTWANYVILFPTLSKKDQLLTDKTVMQKASTDGKKSAVLIVNKENLPEIQVLDFANLAFHKVYTFKEPSTEIIDIYWSVDNTKILVKTKKADAFDYFVLNSNQKDNQIAINLTETFKLNFSKVVWSPVDNQTFYGQRETGVFKINLAEKTVSTPLMDKVVSFEAPNDKSLYFTKLEAENISLLKTDLNGQNQKIITNALPKSKEFKILPSRLNGKIIIIAGDPINSVYLADSIDALFKTTQIGKDFTEAEWSADEKRILLKNNKTILTYDVDKNKVHTVIAEGDIKNAKWDNSNERIYAKLGDACIGIEFDGTNQINFDKCKSKDIISFEHKYYFYIATNDKGNDVLTVYKR